MFAVRVAAMPSPSSQRAGEGTGIRCRVAYKMTIDSLGDKSDICGLFPVVPVQRVVLVVA